MSTEPESPQQNDTPDTSQQIYGGSLAGGIAASLGAKKEPKPYTDQGRAYIHAMADATLDHREAKAAVERDVFSTAIESYNAATNGTSNIHEALRAEAAEVGEVSNKDFDEARFANELGFQADQFKQLGFESYDDAHSSVSKMLHNMTESVGDDGILEDYAALMGEPELRQRLHTEINSWRSPRFGRSTEERTEDQQYHVNQIIGDMIRLTKALVRQGRPAPVVEQALRRARLVRDADYKPSHRDHKPEKISTANQFRNIHELYQNNPF